MQGRDVSLAAARHWASQLATFSPLSTPSNQLEAATTRSSIAIMRRFSAHHIVHRDLPRGISPLWSRGARESEIASADGIGQADGHGGGAAESPASAEGGGNRSRRDTATTGDGVNELLANGVDLLLFVRDRIGAQWRKRRRLTLVR
jgi:hypothetical protein